ncbi:MAG TPA: PHB depolymerase family esterase [Gammaproteobacteria bacterium]|nr:PHB depolymerase family esterase [Gammaproteobacteria bacterium]
MRYPIPMHRSLCFLLLLLAPLLAQAKGDTLVGVEYRDVDRSYLLHLPDPLPNTAMPVVVVLHGGGGNSESIAQQTRFDAMADKNGFIVVYPNGTDQVRPLMNMLGKPGLLTWNAGGCCGYARDQNVDDVGFIRAVVMEVVKDNGADPKRIYATGISNGGMMAYRLACEASDLFAAVAPVAAVQEAKDCKPAHPVSVFHIHGGNDENVPLAGGVGKKALEKESRPPVQDSLDFWVKQDGCTVTVRSQEPGVDMVNYGACEEGTDVQFFLVRDGGHSWPGGARVAEFLDAPSPALNATEAIWDFFSKHAKP